MKKEIDFGVFYTCFTEYEAVSYSLEELYKLYPDIPVYLISDGGSDYSELESKFNGLKTSLEHDSRGLLIRLDTLSPEERTKYVKDSIITFMDRIERAIKYCNKEYLLIMEPDVLVRGKLHVYDENGHLFGSKVNHFEWTKDPINKILKEIPGSIEVTNFGLVPSLFRCETFLKVHKFFKENENYIDAFQSSHHCFCAYDLFLVVFFAALGYEEIFNVEIVECLRHHNWQNSGHPLVHQYREKYPKETYTGRHSINYNG